MHLDITITGRVQGVFFRDTTKKMADQLGIAGWIKNAPDGSVLIAAEGSSENLDRFLEQCRQGPGLARVEKVKSSKSPDQGYSVFEIRY